MDSILLSAKEQVEAVLASGTSRYDPANIAGLCQYVDLQIQHNLYHADCNFAILQMYSLHPSCFDPQVVRKILIKAMMQLPLSEFSECLCLIETDLQKHALIAPIIALENLLQSCAMKKVWEMLKESTLNDVLSIAGFAEAIRKYFAEIISLTYRTISLADLSALLHLSSTNPEMDRIIKQFGWAVEAHPPMIPMSALASKTQTRASETQVTYPRVIIRTDDPNSTKGKTVNNASPHSNFQDHAPASIDQLRHCFTAFKGIKLS